MRAKRTRRRVQGVEGLERRILFSTFTVLNTGDNGGVNPLPFAGTGTLRQAIIDANANPGTDDIDFNVGGGGPQQIVPLAALPNITRTVSIDATTQPGFAGTPVIELAGFLAGGSASGLTLSGSLSGGSTVRGFVVNRFTQNGIQVTGSSTGNAIVGNYVGTDPSGTLDLGNTRNGISVSGSPSNRVGGASPGDGNLVAGNQAEGIFISGSGSCTVQGNTVGCDATGTFAIPNNIGVFLSGSSSCLVGGPGPGAGNLVSGNGNNGISMLQSFSNTVQGNYAGTRAGGVGTLPNALFGINVSSSGSTRVGGVNPGEGNVVCGNVAGGINLTGNSNFNFVQGNSVGVDTAGNAAGNRSRGVNVQNSFFNRIGGPEPGAGNVIAHTVVTVPGFNGFGVVVQSGTGNQIRRNSIHSNGALGIDLLPPFGPNANDPADPDVGGNNLQNAPVITAVGTIAGNTLVAGTLNTTPFRTITVEFFANAAVDPSGRGEGERYLGEATFFTDGAGNGSFAALLPGSVAGQHVSATATDLNSGDTSEFSLNQAATVGPAAVTIADPCGEGGTATLLLGSGDGDDVLVTPVGSTATYEVTINGVSQGAYGDDRIIVVAGDGDDDVRVAGGVDTPAWLFGGDGDDTLHAGSGDSVLVGGVGDDALHGAGGRDLLIGGEGADRAVGNAGDDILIAGRTDFDGDLVGLCAIMDEWTRADLGFADRVNNLKGDTFGGLNFPYHLNSFSVHPDGADQVDHLVGGAGGDWFLYEEAEDGVTGVLNAEAVHNVLL